MLVDSAEVFIFGNPPYLGSRNQEDFHKEDLDFCLSKLKDYRKLDYIAIWFWKAANYIKRSSAKCAFVSTNSITQGEQVLSLWKPIFELNLQIEFGYTSFEWNNNAKNKAHVIVVIIGLSNSNNSQKKLYTNDNVVLCDNINGYLSNARNIFIDNRREPITPLFNTMVYGSEPREGGFLMLDPYDRGCIEKESPNHLKFVKQIVGSNEYINGIIRYCLWIPDEKVDEAITIPFIKDRLEKVTQYRLTSKRADTVKYANRPNQFTNSTYKEEPVLVVPVVSSANRDYLPLGFVEKDVLVLNSAQTIANCDTITFGIIESKLHMVWVKAVVTTQHPMS